MVPLLCDLRQERAGGVRVADRGLVGQAEDLGEAEWIGAVDEGFLELSVDAKALDRGGPAVQCGRAVVRRAVRAPIG